MNLDTAIDLFIGEYKPSTQQAYRGALFLMRDSLGPALSINEVTSPLLMKYFQDVVRTKGFAPATEFKHAKSIKTFFNWCVRVELIAKSPAWVVRSRKPPRRITREKAMTDDELARILEYLRFKTIPKDYALVLFLADTGARRGGAASLQVKDIDLDRLTAVVIEKGDLQRQVAFSEKCAQAIRRWLTYREKHYQCVGDYVFSKHGEPVNAENISLMIRRTCQAVGVRTLSSHSLRHRKGHQFADSRIAPSIAATALGHSDIRITIDHYYPSDWKSAEAALRELMTDDAPATVKQPEQQPHPMKAGKILTVQDWSA